MKTISLLIVIVSSGICSSLNDLDFYPGIRRPDPMKWEREELAIARLTAYLQKQQRRLELQAEAEAEAAAAMDPGETAEQPDFTYRIPVRPPSPELEQFAVAPPDFRYYENNDDYIVEDDPSDLPLRRPSPDRPPYIPYDTPFPDLITKLHSNPPKPITPPDRVSQPALRSDNLPGLLGVAGQGRRRGDHVEVVQVTPSQDETAGVYIIAVVAGISAAVTVGLIAVGIGWYNLQKNVKNASDVEYPAYGVTGPNKDVSPTGDRKLAQSAQMYHYQHQKQQIIAMENRAAGTDRHGSLSEVESDEENEEGDYTVYECPGLAPTGEMEVKNPLFQDDPTPAQSTAKDEPITK